MDLHIMSENQAIKHEPDRQTYAIRIYSSWSDAERPPLRESLLYKAVTEYVFDDNWGDGYDMGPKTINSEIADSIVRDFAQYRRKVNALLVHCGRGVNRSPAVAIALNSVFELGHNSRNLIKSYKALNPLVYRSILEAGQRFKQ